MKAADLKPREEKKKRYKKLSKILIVYNSLTGNTKFIAEVLIDSIEADVLELKPVKEL